jgi:hypothetical protein
MAHKLPVELMAWLGGLFLLALSNPALHHYTLCPFANLGISWCPGCGLGRSISALFHFEFARSFRYHWFGIPAFFILLHRVWQLSKKTI